MHKLTSQGVESIEKIPEKGNIIFFVPSDMALSSKIGQAWDLLGGAGLFIDLTPACDIEEPCIYCDGKMWSGLGGIERFIEGWKAGEFP